MSEFLLEIFCEEIPAKMQKKAAFDFQEIFQNFFEQENIKFQENDLYCFISPNRMTFLAQNIDNIKITPETERFGPKINANIKAVEGFLRSVGLKNISDLQIKIKNDQEYYYSKIAQKESKILDILADNLPDILQKMSLKWPKTMRWHGETSNQNVWVRPIRNILAIFDAKNIDFKFANINASNVTLIDNKKVQIKDFKSYQEKLTDKNIIFDQKDRKELIYNQIETICQNNNFDIIEDPYKSSLIQEIIGLAESPKVLLGKIDDKFMDLPTEILILTIKNHQKYLCIEYPNGNIAPFFIFISNIDGKNNAKIVSDNEKVLRARLSDAKFFLEEDRKIDFSQRTEILKNIIFHERLDSVFNKVNRISAISKFMAIWFPHCDITIIEKIALLSKNDLTTKAVAEFPELQGMIGSYYCKQSNIDKKIADAIEEQYMPTSANDELPMTTHGQLLAISDKLDTICGLFLVNQKPTSSKDPMAIRRMAIGVINIILKNNLQIPFKIIIDKSLSLFSNNIINANYPELKSKDIITLKKSISFEIIHFFLERLKFLLKNDPSLDPKIINEVANSYELQLRNNKQRKYNLIDFVNRIKFINDFTKNKENTKIINLYKRVANIVNIEEKNDDNKFDYRMKRKILLKTKYDRILDNYTRRIYKKLEKITVKHQYQECYDLLKTLEEPLEDFFDNATINTSNKNVRNQRLTLLARIKYLFENIFDFSKI